MKLVKTNSFGTITTTIDGSLYTISLEGTLVSDEVAQKMKGQFLHTIDVEEVAPVGGEQSSVPDNEA